MSSDCGRFISCIFFYFAGNIKIFNKKQCLFHRLYSNCRREYCSVYCKKEPKKPYHLFRQTIGGIQNVWIVKNAGSKNFSPYQASSQGWGKTGLPRWGKHKHVLQLSFTGNRITFPPPWIFDTKNTYNSFTKVEVWLSCYPFYLHFINVAFLWFIRKVHKTFNIKYYKP